MKEDDSALNQQFPYGRADLLKTLHRHFVNLMCFDHGDDAKKEHGGQPAIYNFSGFVITLHGKWLIVTAGHIFAHLNLAISKGGKISHWQIDDSSVSEENLPALLMPLDIDKDVFFLNDDIPGMDYAIFEIPELVRMAMKDRGIEALSEDKWSTDDIQNFSLWILVGTPYSHVNAKFRSESWEKYIATINLIRVFDRPSNLKETQFQRLYAKIDFDSIGTNGPKVKDIGGMSGGPIFGINGTEEKFDYRLIGIQSAWNEIDSVAICAAQPFITAVKDSRSKNSPP